MAAPSWTRTSPTTWEQSYGFMEKFFVRFLGPEGVPSQFTIAANVTFRTDDRLADLEARLRSAWRAMRYYAPTLAATTGKESRTYTIPDEEALQAWEKSTFKIHERGATAERLFQTIQRTGYITLHFLPFAGGDEKTHQIVLQAEHHHLDGRGVYYFYHRFWTVFADRMLQDVTFGDEWKRLPGRIEDLMGLPEKASPSELATALDWISTLGSVKPLAVPIAAERQGREPTVSMRSVMQFSPATTSEIIAACRAKGTTVTAAWVTAFTLALAEIQQSNKNKELAVEKGLAADEGNGLATFATIDMRRFFPADFDKPMSGVACYHSAIPLVVPSGTGKSFAELARGVKTEFHGGNATLERIPTWKPFVDLMTEAILRSSPTESGLLISSLGVEDDYLAHQYGEPEDDGAERGNNSMVELLDVWIADTMMSATSLWLLHTWKGQLNMTATYNEAYFSEEQMMRVLGTMKTILLKGLGVAE